MTSILKAALQLQEHFQKTAGKSRYNRKGVSNALEKARKQYGAQKKDYDTLAKSHAKLTADLNEAKDHMLQTRKHLSRLTKAQQTADIADASDIIFHPDSDDVSYVVDGKECHVAMDDLGEVQMTPWREYQRSKKTPQPTTENIAPDQAKAEDCLPEEEEGKEDDSHEAQDDGWAFDEALADDLLSELMV